MALNSLDRVVCLLLAAEINCCSMVWMSVGEVGLGLT